jgi:hypothetical protein
MRNRGEAGPWRAPGSTPNVPEMYPLPPRKHPNVPEMYPLPPRKHPNVPRRARGFGVVFVA